MRRQSSLSAISENSRINITSRVEYYGFIVDVVKHLAREFPFQFEWLVDTRRTGRRRTADTAPVRSVLAGVYIHLYSPQMVADKHRRQTEEKLN